MDKFNYTKLYQRLYELGYHSGKKNHGLLFVAYIVKNYLFDSIMDIGCSQGMIVETFKNKGRKSIGIDVSPKAIENSKKLGYNNCYVASVTEIPFEENSVDAVFSCDTMEHLIENDVKQAISEIKRVARKYLFLKISYEEEKNRTWINKLHANNKFMGISNLHLTVKDKNWWKNQLEDNSWKIIEDDFNDLIVLKNTREEI